MNKLKYHIDSLNKNIGNKNYAIDRIDLDKHLVSSIEQIHKLLSNNVELKFTKLNEKAVIPSYAKPGDAGADLTAVSLQHLKDKETGVEFYEYDIGLAVEIPQGYVGLIFPRSSITKTDLSLANAVGVIDSGYRGKLTCRFRKTNNSIPLTYKAGDRVAQLVILPYMNVKFTEVKELSESERGSGGWGSSGK